jgi:hypothetical protein
MLPLPLFGATLEVVVSSTRLEAKVALGPNGKGLNLDGDEVDPETQDSFGAKFGGAVRKSDLFAAMDAYAASCECLEFPGEGALIVVQDGTAKCQAATENTCSVTEDTACGQLATYCSLALGLFTPDVDLDGDGKASSLADGLSIGAWLKGTSGAVAGVDGCSD